MNAIDFSKKVVQWYQEHHRLLPWRQTKNPYRIWLSEIILQQTRVSQGLPYYRRFLRKYPHVKSLAAAPEQEVLRMWQGLGYYSRARNLLACARSLVTNYGGEFPHTFDELRRLKGVGDYTAAAIASFAFGERVAVVDGNVFRVLSRVFGVPDDIASPSGKKRFAELANALTPAIDPATHNQAIMEFGALLCTPRNPACDRCPLSFRCVAFSRGAQAEFPVKKKPRKVRRRFFYYIVVRRGDALLMRERTGSGIWKGLWDFPLLESGVRCKPGDLERQLRRSLGRKITPVVSREYKHVLSHQILFARFLEVNIAKGTGWPQGELFTSALPCGVRKIERLPKPVLVSRFLKDRGLKG